MLNALDHVTARQRRFLADAAHELRTPLAGITTTLEVARRHPGAVDTTRLIDDVLAAHQRLNRLVGDLLVLAGVDAQAPRRRTSIDLADLVQDCVARTGRPGIQIETGELASIVVLGDHDHLTRVITNLLDNAVRHAGKTVTVTLATSANHVTLKVGDDGPGIRIEDRETIFERFVPLDDSRNQAQGGTGLGLALVKELVEDHGGTVTVTDQTPPPGAVFTITLPRPPGPDGHTEAGIDEAPARTT